jgi:hypothetical protein
MQELQNVTTSPTHAYIFTHSPVVGAVVSRRSLVFISANTRLRLFLLCIADDSCSAGNTRLTSRMSNNARSEYRSIVASLTSCLHRLRIVTQLFQFVSSSVQRLRFAVIVRRADFNADQLAISPRASMHTRVMHTCSSARLLTSTRHHIARVSTRHRRCLDSNTCHDNPNRSPSTTLHVPP